VPSADRLPIVGLPWNILDAGGQPDGIGIYTRELERALIGEGVSIRRVGAPREGPLRSRGAAAATAGAREHASAIRYPFSWRHSMAAACALHLRLPFGRRIERAIDIYHATDYLVPRLTRTPVVATLHDAIPLARPDWADPRLRKVKNHLLRTFAQSADLVIAISNAAIPELVDHYRIGRERIRVVPLGVDAAWFVDPGPERIARLLASLRVQPGYFLNVGTLQPRKNLDALIDAYERLPDAIRAERQLIVVGKYGWAAEGLRNRLLALRDGGRIVWLEYVDRETLQALYYGAHGFVFPSLAEGFGLPVIEALACGLPIVASDLPALREVAGTQVRFVPPDRIDDIGEALQALHRAQPDTTAIESRRRHARTFTWSECARRTLDVYRELLR
jgi:glycosyltransferase involved in cell wall biosynthesis